MPFWKISIGTFALNATSAEVPDGNNRSNQPRFCFVNKTSRDGFIFWISFAKHSDKVWSTSCFTKLNEVLADLYFSARFTSLFLFFQIRTFAFAQNINFFWLFVRQNQEETALFASICVGFFQQSARFFNGTPIQAKVLVLLIAKE